MLICWLHLFSQNQRGSYCLLPFNSWEKEEEEKKKVKFCRAKVPNPAFLILLKLLQMPISFHLSLCVIWSCELQRCPAGLIRVGLCSIGQVSLLKIISPGKQVLPVSEMGYRWGNASWDMEREDFSPPLNWFVAVAWVQSFPIAEWDYSTNTKISS